MNDECFKTKKFHIILQKKSQWFANTGLTFLTSSNGWSWVATVPCLHSSLHSQLSHTQLGPCITIMVVQALKLVSPTLRQASCSDQEKTFSLTREVLYVM